MNLYPFEATALRRGATHEEVIENIDIGGPTLIRAAAKNHAHVAVVVRPEQYDAVIEELREANGAPAPRRRASRWPPRRSAPPPATMPPSRAGSPSARRTSPTTSWRAFEKVLDLSYGENPHQRAAFYVSRATRTHLLARTVKLHGKELSYNNLLDLDCGRCVCRRSSRCRPR